MQNILGLALIAAVILGIQLGTRYLRTRRLQRWFQRGMTAYKAQSYPEALGAFRNCIRIAPEWLYARTLMGMCLAHTGRKAEALREIELVEALQPKEAETWTLISTFFMVCMPENEERLFEALDRLASMDIKAARLLVGQPFFRKHMDSPRLVALKKQLATADQEL